MKNVAFNFQASKPTITNKTSKQCWKFFTVSHIFVIFFPGQKLIIHHAKHSNYHFRFFKCSCIISSCIAGFRSNFPHMSYRSRSLYHSECEEKCSSSREKNYKFAENENCLTKAEKSKKKNMCRKTFKSSLDRWRKEFTKKTSNQMCEQMDESYREKSRDDSANNTQSHH